MRHPRPLLCLAALAAFLLALGFAPPADATSFVAMRDSALADQAGLIVVARVAGRLPATTDSGRPATDYLVQAERVLKGEVLESALVVRVPGGVGPDGIGLKIWGAPELADGSRVILFLNRGADGLYRPLHLMLGVFHELMVDGRSVAYRHLSEVREAGGADKVAARQLRQVRDFARFADWLEARALGERRRYGYFTRIDPARVQSLHEKYGLMDQDGLNLRWFEFDSGTGVDYFAHQAGQPGVAGGGFTEFQRALATWNNEPGTPIRLVYGGTTAASGGLEDYDYINAILFADPNQEIEGTFDCSAGGTLAYGGPWFNPNVTAVFDGRRFIRIQGGDVVTNDGIDCFFQRSQNASAAAEELFAHELGHTLGMGHSSEDQGETNSLLRDALMYYRIHNDGRGGRLNADDVAGIRYLYAASSGGGDPTCPNSDVTLCMLNGRFRVTMSWTNQFNGVSGIARAVRNSDLTGFFYFDDPQNLELMVKILDFGGQIKVFYGQVTNLRFELVVTDTLTGRSKTYKNTTGECGAIDDDFSKATALGSELLLEGTGDAPAATKALCSPGPNTLCLLGGRFRVEADWRNQFDGSSGVAQAGNLSDLTGYFTFTSPANVEILAKTLDFPDRVLFLWGSLSNLEYTIRLTNMQTGVTKSYYNPPGKFCGGLDNNAF